MYFFTKKQAVYFLVILFLFVQISIYPMENLANPKKDKKKIDKISRINSDPTTSLSKNTGLSKGGRKKSLDSMKDQRSIKNLWGLTKYYKSEESIRFSPLRSSDQWDYSSFKVENPIKGEGDENFVDFCKEKVSDSLRIAIEQRTMPFFSTDTFLSMKENLNEHALYYCLEKIEKEYNYILELVEQEKKLDNFQKALGLYTREIAKCSSTDIQLEKYKKEVCEIKNELGCEGFIFSSDLDNDIKKLLEIIEDKVSFCKKKRGDAASNMASYENIFGFLCRTIDKRQQRFTTIFFTAIIKNSISWVKAITHELKYIDEIINDTSSLIRCALDNRNKWVQQIKSIEYGFTKFSQQQIEENLKAEQASREIVKFILNNVLMELKKNVLFESIKKNNLLHVTLLLEDNPDLASLCDMNTGNSVYIAALCNIKKRKKSHSECLAAESIFSALVKTKPLKDNKLYTHVNKRNQTITSLAEKLKNQIILDHLSLVNKFEELKQQECLNLKKVERAFEQVRGIIQENLSTDFRTLLDQVIDIDCEENTYIKIFASKKSDEKHIVAMLVENYLRYNSNNEWQKQVEAFTMIKTLIHNKKIVKCCTRILNEEFLKSITLLIDSLIEQSIQMICNDNDSEIFASLLVQVLSLDTQETNLKYLSLYLKKLSSNQKRVAVVLFENYLKKQEDEDQAVQQKAIEAICVFIDNKVIYSFYKKLFENIFNEMTKIILSASAEGDKKKEAGELQELLNKVMSLTKFSKTRDKVYFSQSYFDLFSCIDSFSQKHSEYSFL